VTLRIFVGRAEAYRRDTTLEGLSASIDALASSMIALEPRGRVVAIAESGSLAYVLGRTGRLEALTTPSRIE
jgi:hypothetical protein